MLEKKNQHNWKEVYQQIKVIINELDPLGVADEIDDEYEGLNFKCYSQLLDSKSEEQIFEELNKELEGHYGVTVPKEELKSAIKKLKQLRI